MKKAIEKILQNRELNLLGLIIVLLLIVTMRAPSFMELSNMERIVNDTAILIMVAAGQFLVILTGGIDLSVGSTIAFSGMAAAMLNNANPTMPVFFILIIGILIGTALGAFNGVCVAFGKIPPHHYDSGNLEYLQGVYLRAEQGTVDHSP